MELINYNKKCDGANNQEKEVLKALKDFSNSDNVLKRVKVTRYENCREQGYIFYLRALMPYTRKRVQLSIAVYEHRNTDNICIVYSNALTRSEPTNKTIWAEMNDKWDVKKSFRYGSYNECAQYIRKMFNDFMSYNKYLDELDAPKQSWSDNDEYLFNTILHGIDLKREKYKKYGNKEEEERYRTQYEWLKSLKERVLKT